MAFLFDSDQDWGPYETLFNAYNGYNVRISTRQGASGIATILAAGDDHVRVQLWKENDMDRANGKKVKIPFEDIEELLVF